MQTFTGLEYLKIDIANNYSSDNDKLNWNDRLQWFEQNKDNLDDLVNTTDNPALFYTGIKAYRDTLNGIPSGYPISLDACSSGVQILAAIVGCEQTAKHTGLIDTGNRQDLYINLYQIMLNKTDQVAKFDLLIERKDTKQAIMTSFYNSTAMPKKIFGEGKLLDCFYETIQEECPGAYKLNESLQSLWNPNALDHRWIMPDNFHVINKVMDNVSHSVNFNNKLYNIIINTNKPMKEGRSLSPNIVHSIDGMIIREMDRRCNYNITDIINVMKNLNSTNKSYDRENDKIVITLWKHFKESGFLSARILNYLDKDNMGLIDPIYIAKLFKSMPEKPFKCMYIHDCFRVLPNYANDLRKQYNQIMSELAASEILSFLGSSITQRKIQHNKIKDISKDILNANYALS